MSTALTVARTETVSVSPAPNIPDACARAGGEYGGSSAAATNNRQAAGTPINVIIRFGDDSIIITPPSLFLVVREGAGASDETGRQRGRWKYALRPGHVSMSRYALHRVNLPRRTCSPSMPIPSKPSAAMLKAAIVMWNCVVADRASFSSFVLENGRRRQDVHAGCCRCSVSRIRAASSLPSRMLSTAPLPPKGQELGVGVGTLAFVDDPLAGETGISKRRGLRLLRRGRAADHRARDRRGSDQAL